QAARYFSQAHLYLKGTSWLTSVVALMTRLSSALTRLSGAGAFFSFVGAGIGAGLVRPAGVEWIVCSPTVRAVGATGVSCSELSLWRLFCWRLGGRLFLWLWACTAQYWNKTSKLGLLR